MIPLILLLVASESASAGSSGKSIYLNQGQKAPFQGTLINDDGLRDIDIDLIQKDACEKKLYDTPHQNLSSWGWEGLVLGMFVGGFAVYTLSH